MVQAFPDGGTLRSNRLLHRMAIRSHPAVPGRGRPRHVGWLSFRPPSYNRFIPERRPTVGLVGALFRLLTPPARPHVPAPKALPGWYSFHFIYRTIPHLQSLTPHRAFRILRSVSRPFAD